MAARDLTVTEEELALVEDKLMDDARKRLKAETSVHVERVLDGVGEGEFVVISAPADVEEPFYIAKVSNICG